MSQKPALGKGLASLLPGASAPAAPIPSRPSGLTPPLEAGLTAPAGAIAAGPPAPVSNGLNVAAAHVTDSSNRIPGISLAMVDEITPNPYQPRREFDAKTLAELAESIKVSGVIQPLAVRRTPKGYELIAGERRLRAAKLAGVKMVPVVINRTTDKESLELALVENIQREDLNCIDAALAYQQLCEEFNLTQEEAAKRVGKERATVANHLRLLRLPEAIIDDLRKNVLTFGHGKALLGVEDSDQRLWVRAQVVSKKLSVRETEALVDRLKAGVSQDSAAPAPTIVDQKDPVRARLANLSQDLTRHFSARVEIKGSDKRGKIVLHYTSRLELERLLASVQK